MQVLTTHSQGMKVITKLNRDKKVPAANAPAVPASTSTSGPDLTVKQLSEEIEALRQANLDQSKTIFL